MTRNELVDRMTNLALPGPLRTSDLVQLFTITSAEVDWACDVIRSVWLNTAPVTTFSQR